MSTYTPGTATWKFKEGNNVSPVGYTQSNLQTIRDTNGQCFTQQAGMVFLNESKTTAGTYIEDEVFADYLEARIKEDLLSILVRQPKVAFDHLKTSILQNIKAFSKFTGKELETQRQDKFIAMGQFKG